MCTMAAHSRPRSLCRLYVDDRRRSKYTQFTAQCQCAVHPAPTPAAVCDRHCSHRTPLLLLLLVGAVAADSSEYQQHFSVTGGQLASSRPSSSPTATLPLSFPRRDERMAVLAAEQVQRAADPLAPFGGRVPRMTDSNTVTIVAGASRKNTAYATHTRYSRPAVRLALLRTVVSFGCCGPAGAVSVCAPFPFVVSPSWQSTYELHDQRIGTTVARHRSLGKVRSPNMQRTHISHCMCQHRRC